MPSLKKKATKNQEQEVLPLEAPLLQSTDSSTVADDGDLKTEDSFSSEEISAHDSDRGDGDKTVSESEEEDDSLDEEEALERQIIKKFMNSRARGTLEYERPSLIRDRDNEKSDWHLRRISTRPEACFDSPAQKTQSRMTI